MSETGSGGDDSTCWVTLLAFPAGRVARRYCPQSGGLGLATLSDTPGNGRTLPIVKRRYLLSGIAVLAVAGVICGLVLFKPWLLFVDVRVDDALPQVTPTSEPEIVTPAAGNESASPAGPTQLSAGALVSHAHETSGTVRIVENPDGSRVLSIENLSTSSGPDVHVWLSAANVVAGSDGTSTAGGAEYLDLGSIKGNLGNQVYDIPAGTDLSKYRSVDLWCVQFSVSFGAAQLA